MTGVVIGIVLCVLLLVPVGVLVAVKIRQTRAAKWVALPSFPAVLVCLPSTQGPTVNLVDLNLQYARASLVALGPWPTEKVDGALASLRIVVMPSASWLDSIGRSVGGEALYSAVTVDVGLTSLCHELAHVLEFYADGATDGEHANWVKRGIAAADESYRKKLI